MHRGQGDAAGSRGDRRPVLGRARGLPVVAGQEAARGPHGDARRARAGIIKELAAVVRDFPGEAPVVLDLVTSEGARVFQFGADYRVRPEPDFFAEVKALLGEAAVA